MTKKNFFKLSIILILCLAAGFFLYLNLKVEKIKKNSDNRTYQNIFKNLKPLMISKDAFRFAISDSGIICLKENSIYIYNFFTQHTKDFKISNIYNAELKKGILKIYNEKVNKIYTYSDYNKITDSLFVKTNNDDVFFNNGQVFLTDTKLSENNILNYGLLSIHDSLRINLAEVFKNELDSCISECKFFLAEGRIFGDDESIFYLPSKLGYFIVFDRQTRKYNKYPTINNLRMLKQKYVEFDVPGMGKGFKCEGVQAEYLQNSMAMNKDLIFIHPTTIIRQGKSDYFSNIDVYDRKTNLYQYSYKMYLENAEESILDICYFDNKLFVLKDNGNIYSLAYNEN